MLPLDRGMLPDGVVGELPAQPDAFDRRVDRGQRQRDQRADHAGDLGANREGDE